VCAPGAELRLADRHHLRLDERPPAFTRGHRPLLVSSAGFATPATPWSSVEHDVDIVAAADHVIEIGPGAGPNGGRVIVAGPPATWHRLGLSNGPHLREGSIAPPGARRTLSPASACAARPFTISGPRCRRTRRRPRRGDRRLGSGSRRSSSTSLRRRSNVRWRRRRHAGAASTATPSSCGEVLSVAPLVRQVSSSPWSNAATHVGASRPSAPCSRLTEAKALGLRKRTSRRPPAAGAKRAKAAGRRE